MVPDQPHDGEVGEGDSQPVQVFRIGAPEGVYGLGVVADAGQAASFGLKQPHDVGLYRVHVLILIDQHRIEHAPQDRPGGGIGQRRPPQQQQVIEVDQGVAALVRDITAEQLGELAGVLGTPGEAAAHDIGDRHLGVHAPGIDVGADRGAWRAALRAHQPVIHPAGIQQIGHVRRIDDGELGRQGERLRVLANDPVGNRVEGPAGDPPAGRPGAGSGARQHVISGAAGKGQQQDPAGLHTLLAQPGRAGDQRARLAGTGPGKDQQRPAWVRRR